MVLGPIDNWSMDRRKKVGRALFIVGAVLVWAINIPSITIGSVVYQSLILIGGSFCVAGTSVIVLRPGRVYGDTDDALTASHE